MAREKWCPELVELSNELSDMLLNVMKAKRVDHSQPEKPLMMFFLGKAYKTHKAIVILAGQGYGEDAGILARSLLNLLINALWIHQDADNRVGAFVEHDWVQRARLGRKFIENPALLGSKRQALLTQIKKSQPQLEEQAKRVRDTYGSNNQSW